MPADFNLTEVRFIATILGKESVYNVVFFGKPPDVQITSGSLVNLVACPIRITQKWGVLTMYAKVLVLQQLDAENLLLQVMPKNYMCRGSG